ncbi:MAG: hypothetical protein LAQ69_36960 [Acidobacteriia bacterium]|nr:hypothetical protein [Terriglobia bacterium]
MCFNFDPRKSNRLRANPRRGIGFEEAQELFSRPHWLDQRRDVPEQYLAIGPVFAEAIARLADRGKDISGFFKNQGRMVQPIQRVNVDLTATMLEELDRAPPLPGLNPGNSAPTAPRCSAK